MENVKLNEGFKQVCVWPGTIVEPGDEENFVQLIKEIFDTQVQYLEQIKTKPDLDTDGLPIEDSGGRNDLFFAVHQDDVGKFAVPRLAYGIRWIEDAMAEHNHTKHLYPERIKGYMCWDPEI